MSTQELVVMVGLQGSGKSRWVAEHLAGTHAVVSKDHWPNARHREARQQRVVAALLAEGASVVVDNTSPAPAERAPLVALAAEGRARVPLVGLYSAAGRLVPPSTAEGFSEVTWVGRGAGLIPWRVGRSPVRTRGRRRSAAGGPRRW